MTDASMRPGPLTRAQAVSIRAECRVTTWPNFIRDVAAANEIAARRFSECDGSLQFEVYSSLLIAREADPSRTPIAWKMGSAVQVRVFFRAEAAAPPAVAHHSCGTEPPSSSVQLVRRLSAGERAVGERAVADEEFEATCGVTRFCCGFAATRCCGFAVLLQFCCGFLAPPSPSPGPVSCTPSSPPSFPRSI